MDKFNGKKAFVLTNSNNFGGKNILLETFYYICAALSFMLALLFLARNLMTDGKFGKN